MDSTATVYMIKNTVNSKVYIGSTTQPLETRLIQHKSHARTYFRNSLFSCAILELGEENFSIETIEECNSSDRYDREGYWMKEFNSFENGYNEKKVGSILAYDIDGIFLGKFKSIAAAHVALGLSYRCMQGNLYGEQHRVGNVTLFYELDFNTDELANRLRLIKESSQANMNKEFNCYDRFGVHVGTFMSKTECANSLGLTRQLIGQCLIGNRRTHKGFAFSYLL